MTSLILAIKDLVDYKLFDSPPAEYIIGITLFIFSDTCRMGRCSLSSSYKLEKLNTGEHLAPGLVSMSKQEIVQDWCHNICKIVHDVASHYVWVEHLSNSIG